MLLSRLRKKGLEYLGLDGPKAVISLTIEHGLTKLVVSRGLEVLEYRVVVANPRFFKESLVSEPRGMANVLPRALVICEQESLDDLAVNVGLALSEA